MNLLTFIELLREELTKELSVKTGWGRLEVLRAFEVAVTKAVLRFPAQITLP